MKCGCDAERAAAVLEDKCESLVHRTGLFPRHPPSYLSAMSPVWTVLDAGSKHCYSNPVMPKQLALALPKAGGRRRGAGRPRTRPHPGLIGPGVPHLKRPALSRHHPVHVTLRVVPGVGYLRAPSPAKVILQAIREVDKQLGLRVVHYSVQG